MDTVSITKNSNMALFFETRCEASGAAYLVARLFDSEREINGDMHPVVDVREAVERSDSPLAPYWLITVDYPGKRGTYYVKAPSLP